MSLRRGTSPEAHDDFSFHSEDEEDSSHLTHHGMFKPLSSFSVHHPASTKLELDRRTDEDSGLCNSSKATTSIGSSSDQDESDTEERGAFDYLPSQTRKTVTISKPVTKQEYHLDYDEAHEGESDKTSQGDIDSPRSDFSSGKDDDSTRGTEMQTFSIRETRERSMDNDFEADEDSDDEIKLKSVHQHIYGSHSTYGGYTPMRAEDYEDTPLSFSRSKGASTSSLRKNVDEGVSFPTLRYRQYSYSSDEVSVEVKKEPRRGYCDPPFGQGNDQFKKVANSIQPLLTSYKGTSTTKALEENRLLEETGQKKKKNKGVKDRQRLDNKTRDKIRMNRGYIVNTLSKAANTSDFLGYLAAKPNPFLTDKKLQKMQDLNNPRLNILEVMDLVLRGGHQEFSQFCVALWKFKYLDLAKLLDPEIEYDTTNVDTVETKVDDVKTNVDAVAVDTKMDAVDTEVEQVNTVDTMVDAVDTKVTQTKGHRRKWKNEMGIKDGSEKSEDEDEDVPLQKLSKKEDSPAINKGEGFLCPICKKSLPSSEELQVHYDAAHDNKSVNHSENRDGDVLALRQEIDDLKVTLQQERSYTQDLKHELEKRQSGEAGSGMPLNAKQLLGDEGKARLAEAQPRARQEDGRKKSTDILQKLLEDEVETCTTSAAESTSHDLDFGGRWRHQSSPQEPQSSTNPQPVISSPITSFVQAPVTSTAQASANGAFLLKELFPGEPAKKPSDTSALMQSKNLDNLLHILWEKDSDTSNSSNKEMVMRLQRQKRKASVDVDSSDGMDSEPSTSSTSNSVTPSKLLKSNVLLAKLLSKQAKKETVVNTQITVSHSSLPQQRFPKNISDKIVTVKPTDSKLTLPEDIDTNMKEVNKTPNIRDNPRTNPDSPFPGNTKPSSQIPAGPSGVDIGQNTNMNSVFQQQVENSLQQQHLQQQKSQQRQQQQQFQDQMDHLQQLLVQTSQPNEGSRMDIDLPAENDPLLAQILQQAQDLQQDLSTGSLQNVNTQNVPQPSGGTDDVAILSQLEQLFGDPNLSVSELDNFLGIAHPQLNSADVNEQMAIDAIQKQLMSEEPFSPPSSLSSGPSPTPQQAVTPPMNNAGFGQGLMGQQHVINQISGLSFPQQMAPQQQQQQQQAANPMARQVFSFRQTNPNFGVPSPRLPQPQRPLASALQGVQQQRPLFRNMNTTAMQLRQAVEKRRLMQQQQERLHLQRQELGQQFRQRIPTEEREKQRRERREKKEREMRESERDKDKARYDGDDRKKKRPEEKDRRDDRHSKSERYEEKKKPRSRDVDDGKKSSHSRTLSDKKHSKKREVVSAKSRSHKPAVEEKVEEEDDYEDDFETVLIPVTSMTGGTTMTNPQPSLDILCPAGIPGIPPKLERKQPRKIAPKLPYQPSAANGNGIPPPKQNEPVKKLLQEKVPASPAVSCNPPRPPPGGSGCLQQAQQVNRQQNLLNLARRTVADISSQQLRFQDEEGDTYLHVAVCRADKNMVQALLERLRRENLHAMVDVQNKSRQTPLYLAAADNQPAMVHMFITFGADVNIPAQVVARDGISVDVKAPIHCASCGGKESERTLQELLKAKDINVNSINSEGQTALHCAIAAHGMPKRSRDGCIDSVPIVDMLIREGADPNAQDKKNGKTPLMYAIEGKDYRLVEALIRLIGHEKIRTIIKTQTFDGRNCMRIAEGLKIDYGQQWPRICQLLSSASSGELPKSYGR